MTPTHDDPGLQGAAIRDIINDAAAHGYAIGAQRGSMTAVAYAPRHTDAQTAHEQDEVYIVARGRARLAVDDNRTTCEVGDLWLVPAGAHHCFDAMSDDFLVWAVFWGPAGGDT